MNSIRARREAAGLTQTELGERAELSQGTVSALECGTIEIGLARARRLAAVLGCTIDELLSEPERATGTEA